MAAYANFDLKTPGNFYYYQNATAGDYLRFRFYIVDISNSFGEGGSVGAKEFDFYINSYAPNSPGVSTLTRGYFEVEDAQTQVTSYVYTSSYGQIPQLFTSPNPTTLVFSSASFYLFQTASTFLPQPPTSQYYTPVVDYFGVQKYDLVRLGSFNNSSPQYYEIINVSSSAPNVYVTLNRPITASFNDYAQNFAIFRRKPDETSVIIDFKKTPGEVSQTILVPYNINDTTKGSIGNIFKTLNTDLQ
jgi:hypothetical protein